METTYCPSCGRADVSVGLDSVLIETRPVVRRHACGIGGPGSAAPTYIGQQVRMTWVGGTRDGRISGEFRADSLPTGATFVPVTWDDDGTTDNVDSRVLSSLLS